ncbi:DUF1963 domain-containing protein [Erythrobacter sp. WG]|uniref:DUF1963 domain-containing protein n=1 Tax=Erythrobacter sp. WG TaxID=2985510 RepID=UPI00226E2B48|nr:DUF1963 domain-containing protein [Erythrobacter sp. WG]MCX9146731.1 DUF1963 domain-containing protein [Erythrobacter sp. WG]
MSFYGFLGLAAVVFVLALRFVAFVARTVVAAGGRPRAGSEPPRGRQADFRTATGSEPPESEWLRPEPLVNVLRAAAARADFAADAARAASARAEAKRKHEEHSAELRDRWNARRAPEPVEERATVVLRKQIPPRDEPPRSWIGGLPMMPEHIAWPRLINDEKDGDEEEPCHFICQIALADCHPDLWGGLGPREGWLLLFANSNHHEGNYSFVYTRELGPERTPPADIGPIHDGTYTGQTTWTARETVYPRFPVDLVSMPNRTYERDGVIYASPENLAQLLYEGQPIGKTGPYRGLKEPFTWGCVALAARAAIAAIDDRSAKVTSDRYRRNMREKLLAPGGFEGVIIAKRYDVDQMLASQGMDAVLAADPATLDEVGRGRLATLEKRREALAATEALLERYRDPEALLAFLDDEGEQAWCDDARAVLVVLADYAEEMGRDAPLGEAEWETICTRLAGYDKPIWTLAWGRTSERGLPVTVDQRTLSIVERLGHHMTAACVDEAMRCYLDQRLRALIPADELPGLEAHLRGLDDNRPCRMGGYSDGVQHDVGPHPHGKLLLLQMSCDWNMGTLWGDCGAIYAFISPGDLAAGHFDRADVHLECY